jgi:UDP-glucose 4-epimerase
MRTLVTGSAGHLGEALVPTLRHLNHDVVGLDILQAPCTTDVGSILDRAFVRCCMSGVRTVFHTATLHKPHVATHSRQDFVDTNITGTLNLLEEAVTAGVGSFVFTSTTSAFGDALIPPPGVPAAWVTEEVTAIPRNIYRVTKGAAEDFCQLFHRNHGLGCIVLRTSRFFPEEDDDKVTRETYAGDNAKANEFLCPPDIHIFTSSKQPWVTLPPGAKAVPEFYDLAAVWPPESLERLRIMREGLRGQS